MTSITTPAKNGVYDIGYSDEDRIDPTGPGYYVIVSDFTGDDRVQPFRSSPDDIRERFYVPDREQPLSVITQATPAALVGELFDDAALVQGTDIPVDSYLIFRAYGPQDPAEQPQCEDPFFVSERIKVTQAGIYRSGPTSVTTAGNVYWVETLYDADDNPLSTGVCGAPGETTVISENPTVTVTVTTSAVPEVLLGDPAHDVATITGTVPDGATLSFEAFLQSGDTAVCTPETLVVTTSTIAVAGPGQYRSEDVIFTEVGTYSWVETLLGPDGTILSRGTCGAPNETTRVVTVPTVPPTPSELAQTGGAPLWMPILIALAAALLAGGTILWFGKLQNGATAEKEEEPLSSEPEAP